MGGKPPNRIPFSTRNTRTYIGLAILVSGIVILAFLVAWSLRAGGSEQLSPSSRPGNETAPAVPTIPPELSSRVLPDMEHIPLYPGGTVVEAKEEGITRRKLIQLVNDDPTTEAALTYYRQVLPRYGWRILEDRPYSPTYVWQDPVGKLPWDLFLWVGGQRGSLGEPLLHIDFNRYPNISRIPLYEDAVEIRVERKDVPFSDARGSQDYDGTLVPVTITTYTTKATPEEVEAFYSRLLPQHSWGWAEYVPLPSEKTTPTPVRSSRRQEWGSTHPTRDWEQMGRVRLRINIYVADGSTKVVLQVALFGPPEL